MPTATHAFHFYKDHLEAGASVAPALAARHRFVYVAAGAATVDGEALDAESVAYGHDAMAINAGRDGAELWRWELTPADAQPILAAGDGVRSEHLATRPVDTMGIDTRDTWLFRCDSIEMPKGGGAPLHVHPGPGLRCMVYGSMTVDDKGHVEEYGPGEWWYETNVQPIVAKSTGENGNRFVRVMIVAPEFEGIRTTQFIDPAAPEKNKAKPSKWLLYADRIISP